MKKQISTIVGIVVIITIAVVTVGGAFLYLQKSKTQTTNAQNSNIQIADWKTYSNTTYGYEFKYPSTWQSGNGPTDLYYDTEKFARSSDSFNDAFYGPAGDTAFSVAVAKKLQTGGLTEKEPLKDESDPNKYFSWEKEQIKKDKKYTNYQELNFLGYPAIYFDHKNDNVGGKIEYDFVRDNKYYAIIIDYNKESDGIGQKIVSTFKFTK